MRDVLRWRYSATYPTNVCAAVIDYEVGGGACVETAAIAECAEHAPGALLSPIKDGGLQSLANTKLELAHG